VAESCFYFIWTLGRSGKCSDGVFIIAASTAVTIFLQSARPILCLRSSLRPLLMEYDPVEAPPPPIKVDGTGGILRAPLRLLRQAADGFNKAREFNKANLSLSNFGRYCLLKLVFMEFVEVVMQVYSINDLAKSLDMIDLTQYVVVVFLNCLVTAALLYLNNRVPVEVHALNDIIFDLAYSGLNVYFRLGGNSPFRNLDTFTIFAPVFLALGKIKGVLVARIRRTLVQRLVVENVSRWEAQAVQEYRGEVPSSEASASEASVSSPVRLAAQVSRVLSTGKLPKDRAEKVAWENDDKDALGLWPWCLLGPFASRRCSWHPWVSSCISLLLSEETLRPSGANRSTAHASGEELSRKCISRGAYSARLRVGKIGSRGSSSSEILPLGTAAVTL
jgi:hypothetical protein